MTRPESRTPEQIALQARCRLRAIGAAESIHAASVITPIDCASAVLPSGEHIAVHIDREQFADRTVRYTMHVRHDGGLETWHFGTECGARVGLPLVLRGDFARSASLSR